MASEWRETSLASVAMISSGKRPARVLKEAAGDCQIPVIGGGGPSGYTDSALFDGGVLITGRVGTLGKLFAPTGPCWPSDNALVVRPNSVETNPRFLRYALQQVIVEAAGMNRGAANPLITQGDLGRLSIGHPSLPDQRAIAHILGTLDDKIELNRRMSETLEAMARALFKSWFVDFDPVRAKAEGRDTGLPQPLADLFPARLVDSELGEIPEGWEVVPLAALGELAIGGDWGEDKAFSGAIEASCLRGVDLEHLRCDGHASAPRRWFKPASVERRAMDERDVLVAGSGAGPTGRPLWMCEGLLLSLGPCIYSNFCKRIRCGSPAKAVYLDTWLHGMRESGEIWEYVNGTSVPNLDAKSLLSGKVVPMPPMSVLDKYYDFVRPIWLVKYMGENHTLAILRDALLPRLISGEVRTTNAGQVVEKRTEQTDERVCK